MAISTGKRRKHAPRTEAYLAHEAFGFALGRLFEVAPHLQEPILAGIARAKRASAGLVPTLEEVKRAVLLAGEQVRAAHGISSSPPAQPAPVSRPPRRSRSSRRSRAKRGPSGQTFEVTRG